VARTPRLAKALAKGWDFRCGPRKVPAGGSGAPQGPARLRHRGKGVNWHESVFELIDMRSFSNLWYWIALAVLWSSASHYVLGVPFDMVTRARRLGGQAAADLDDLVRVNVNRQLHIARVAGVWSVAIASCLVTLLAVLGFVYRVEFCQALLLLVLPMVVLAAMRIRTARRIAGEAAQGEALWRLLARLRLWTQALGILSIFVTATWGMYMNLNYGVLGGG